MRQYVASHLKNMNRMQVYNVIKNNTEVSRSKIVNITGVSMPTVLKITNYLEETGMISLVGEANTSMGRKPKIFKVNPKYRYAVGIYYEGEYLKIGIVDITGNIIGTTTLKVRKFKFEDVISKVIPANVEKLITDNSIDKRKIAGLGIGIPGVVDLENQTVGYGPLIGIFYNYDMSHLIKQTEDIMGLPISIFNDVNSAAIGEYIFRDEEEDLVYISLGTGLGSGIIINGKAHLGRNYSAGEIGYMVTDESFTSSEYTPGFMESKINLDVLNQMFEGFEDGSITDENLILAREYVAKNLGQCIVNIISVVDISCIILGGVVIDILGSSIINVIKSYVKKISLFDINIELGKCSVPTILGTGMMVIENELESTFLKKGS